MLPLPVLYAASSVLAPVVGSVVRYRRRVVDANLAMCFPQFTAGERRAVARQFYRNFTDYVVETVKLLHISDAQMMRRMEFTGLEHITRHLDQGRSVVAYFSHCGCWEWAPSITLHCSAQVERGDAFCQIYRPLRNAAIDALMLKLRSRFGSESIPKNTALRSFLAMRRDGIPSVTGFMSDQKPGHGDGTHTVLFMGQETPVITGTETLARRLGMAAVYWDMVKTSRGHYRIDIVPMCDNAADTQQYALTDQYFQLLQQTINRNPAIWLWSHNRWKIKTK